MPNDLEFMKAVGDAVTALGWPLTLEYPGFLEGGCKDTDPRFPSDLSIAIGPATDGGPTWTADYIRDGEHVGSWEVPATTDATVLAQALHQKLMTANVED